MEADLAAEGELTGQRTGRCRDQKQTRAVLVQRVGRKRLIWRLQGKGHDDADHGRDREGL
eukprot:1216093-Rhodomonas_salina.1